MFDITLQRLGGVAVLRLEGELIFGRPVDSLHVAVRELTASKQVRVILDLAGITRIDSSGLGALLGSRADLDRVDGRVVLLSPSDRVRLSLTRMRFPSVFQIADTELAAVRMLAE